MKRWSALQREICRIIEGVVETGSHKKRGIRFADAIIEWGLLSQVPKPAKLLNAGEFRDLRIATRGSASGLRELFEKSSIKNFNPVRAGCVIINP